MTMLRDDYLLAGMRDASTVALSCAGATSANAALRRAERGGFSQPRLFWQLCRLSALAVGLCSGHKQAAEEKSHISLSFAVHPARNVA
ncbi:hypothetical protein [Mycobacterium sp. URHB0044]|uniref:hypothetical protein n=1 Tax=Mycobacterium sp. URHB0044 TaxID=1380386 RepID=UPI0012DE742E|nr:hypothetical protein [Mycobacterium sp. URHB0044]